MSDTNPRVLFTLDRLAPGTAFSIEIPDAPYAREVFVVCTDRAFHVYENSCPHTGGPLDWMPNQFLSLDKAYIQCSTHNALFTLEEGCCVSGPCTGRYLQSVPVFTRDGKVYLQE